MLKGRTYSDWLRLHQILLLAHGVWKDGWQSCCTVTRLWAHARPVWAPGTPGGKASTRFMALSGWTQGTESHIWNRRILWTRATPLWALPSPGRQPNSRSTTQRRPTWACPPWRSTSSLGPLARRPCLGSDATLRPCLSLWCVASPSPHNGKTFVSEETVGHKFGVATSLTVLCCGIQHRQTHAASGVLTDSHLVLVCYQGVVYHIHPWQFGGNHAVAVHLQGNLSAMLECS